MWLVLGVVALLLLATHFTALVGFAVSAADRGEPVRLDAPTVALLVRDGVAKALLVSLSPLGLGQRPPTFSAVEPPQGLERARVPVILVPGYGHNRSAMTFLRIFLVQRGWPWVWPVNVHSRDASLADMAQELGRRVDEMLRVSGAQRVDVVGQSLGGLVAAWYVRHLDGGDKVRRLVTLGTPWRGTRMAVFARDRAASELAYGAPVLDGLAPPPVPTLAVWSPADTVVVPPESAAPDGVETVCIERLAHTEMLLSSRAFRAVKEALSHLPSQVPSGLPEPAGTPEHAQAREAP